MLFSSQFPVHTEAGMHFPLSVADFAKILSKHIAPTVKQATIEN